jgi:phosphate transport system substrate-binding protein
MKFDFITGSARRLSRLALTAALAVFTISSIPAHAEDTLIWMGCGISKKAYMGKMAEAYTEKTGVRFRMAGGGATKGIRLTAAGKADVGGSCRYVLLRPRGEPMDGEEVDMIHVAWDALAVIVNRANPVDNLTLEQLKGIFTGRITNWSQVGGPDQPIRLLVRNGRVSGVGRLFRQLVLRDDLYEFPKSAAFFASSGPLERNLEKRPSLKFGIGVTGISSAKKTELKVLKIDGAAPDKEQIASGAYPLFRPLYMTLHKRPGKEARSFVDFVLSDEGQGIISQQGTVNLAEGRDLEPAWARNGLPL